jgi:hypothetical protein
LKLPSKSLFIIGNLFFLLLYLGIFFARKRKRIAVVELAIILLTGLYGFLGVLLLPTMKK